MDRPAFTFPEPAPQGLRPILRLIVTLQDVIRLLIEPDARRQGRFTARVESGAEALVAGTRQPLADGARVGAP